MKQYRKIDLFWCGDYLCTTTQSKTLKEAKRRYLESLETKSHQLGGLGHLEQRILNTASMGLLKASFQK